ncbi:MAG: CPBP family intramembrane metalloprotease [Enterobacterales bacterium]|nr:CPBP family intramembrane metalloprotease [Enterobacterales bacterium]
MLKLYKNPLLFYVLATIIPWACWFTAGHLSHLPDANTTNTILISALSFLGLCAPVLITYVLMLKNPDLYHDIMGRLFTFKGIKLKYIVFTLCFMPLSILLAQAVSLLFGYSSSQFMITGEFTFSSGVFPVWLLLIVTPLIEELGWHSYGTDCLRNRFNLLKTCLIFGLFWGIWHIPLSSINNYYHSNVVEIGALHSLNFLISIFPFVLIMNWLYYKTNRNIWITVIFHITAGYFNEIFATHPDSKLIQTLLLIIFSIFLVLQDKKFFFNCDNGINSESSSYLSEVSK